MANKRGVFSTERKPALTGDQMLEALTNKRATQMQNLRAMQEAKRLCDATPDFTKTLESSMQETERKLKNASMLENMTYANGNRNIGLARLGIKKRMVTEGIEYLKGKVLGEIIYESYWLDEPVKENAVEQIAETIEEMLSYIEESFKGSSVAETNYSPLMKNLKVVIEETAEKAANRICEDCKKDDTVYPDFNLTDAEEDEMDEKLVDLGKDELVDLIKSKVAQVVQDEKEKGQERADMFKEIDQMSTDVATNAEGDTENGDSGESSAAGETATANTDSSSTTESTECKYPLGSVTYTANEVHIINLLESGVNVALFDDPSWGEFKAYVSAMCKIIRVALNRGINRANTNSQSEKYCRAKCLIEELEQKLSNVPETVPADVKEFIMAMVAIIYTAVPADSVIISRLGKPIGSPDLVSASPAVNFTTISWQDLFVNIKTNFASIKDYCVDQMSDGTITQNDINGSDCPVSGKNSLAQLVTTSQTRALTKSIGGSLFEAMMLGCISESSRVAMESNLQINDGEVENAALIESVLTYTVFETLDTMGIYKFRMGDINVMKQHFMKPISEGSTSQILSHGKGKKGLKKVRINTKKLKNKKNVMKEGLFKNKDE